MEKIPISSWKFTQEDSKKSSTGWNQSSPTRSLVTILCLQTLHYTVNFGLTKNFCNLFCLRLLFFLFDDFYLSSADAKVTNFIECFTKISTSIHHIRLLSYHVDVIDVCKRKTKYTLRVLGVPCSVTADVKPNHCESARSAFTQ